MKRPGRWWLLGGAALAVLTVLGLISSFLEEPETAPDQATAPALQGPDTASATVTTSPSEPSRLVLTYFYYWYDLPDGAHSTALTHHPVTDASYRDPDWFSHQLTDMQTAGIDVALAVYWGDEEPSSDAGLEVMVQAAHDLRAAGEATPSIGLFLDTGLIGRWEYDERDLRQRPNLERFYDLVARFYGAVPRELWGTVDGRPFVWLWGSWFDIRFDQAVFDYVYDRFESEYGVRPYIVADNSWRYAITPGFLGRLSADESEPIAVDDFYSWGAALEGYREEGGNVAQIGPGYDERALGGSADRVGRVTDRDGGAFYRRSWEAAIASGKPLIAIETWNEFHEASDIAHSVEHGRRYIEITRDYAERFKSR